MGAVPARASALTARDSMTAAEVAAPFDALPALESLARRFGIAVDPPPLES